jgi:PAS domain S-box-containing protein
MQHSQLASGLLEAAPDAIVGVSAAGVIVLVNAQAERLFGYPRDELLGQRLEVLVSDSARARHPQHRADFAADPSPRPMGPDMDLAARRRDGTEFQAEISLSAIGTGDAMIISAAVRDVTARKRAEEKFRGLLEAAPDAIVGVSADGVIVLVNAQTERLFGYRRAELLGERLELLVPESARAGHPQHRADYAAEPSQRPMGAGMELAGRRKDGTEFPAEISLSAIETGEGIIASAAVRDVTHRKHIEQQLREKNAELEQIAKAKDTFLASMSHELRTPLNAIIGFTGTLLMELPGPLNADQARQLRTVEHSGRHLLAIINELLDLAKIDSGNVELVLEPVDCVELVETVTSSLRPLATDKGLEFTVGLPDEAVIVRSDQRALGQILINLVSNAVKFTDAGRVHVWLDAGSGNGGTTISVSDTGPGIRGDDVGRIFNAFERGEGGARGAEGTGLGLHISHQLATLIGAEVTVDTVYGSGSTFTVVLEASR